MADRSGGGREEQPVAVKEERLKGGQLRKKQKPPKGSVIKGGAIRKAEKTIKRQDRIEAELEALDPALGSGKLSQIQVSERPGGSNDDLVTNSILVRQLDLLSARISRLEEKINTLTRLELLDSFDLPYPDAIIANRARLFSQNQEDGMVLYLLRLAGQASRTFVEIGCGQNGGNSGFLAAELGFTGLMIDADPHKTEIARRIFNSERVDIRTSFVTVENVNDLVSSVNIRGDIDFLGIDIDGRDYWIWEAISVIEPRIVVAEYNSIFGPHRAVVVPHDSPHQRQKQGVSNLAAHSGSFPYWGASLLALQKLATRKGYRLVAVEPRGVNAFFLRNDIATEVPECSVEDVYHKLNKHAKREQELGRDAFDIVEELGLPFVEV